MGTTISGGTIPFPQCNSRPIYELTRELRTLCKGLNETAGKLTNAASTAQAGWKGAASEAFGKHVGRRSSRFSEAASTLGSAIPVLEKFAAVLDSSQQMYNFAVPKECNMYTYAWAIAEESAALVALQTAGAACGGAIGFGLLRELLFDDDDAPPSAPANGELSEQTWSDWFAGWVKWAWDGITAPDDPAGIVSPPGTVPTTPVPPATTPEQELLRDLDRGHEDYFAQGGVNIPIKLVNGKFGGEMHAIMREKLDGTYVVEFKMKGEIAASLLRKRLGAEAGVAIGSEGTLIYRFANREEALRFTNGFVESVVPTPGEMIIHGLPTLPSGGSGVVNDAAIDGARYLRQFDRNYETLKFTQEGSISGAVDFGVGEGKVKLASLAEVDVAKGTMTSGLELSGEGELRGGGMVVDGDGKVKVEVVSKGLVPQEFVISGEGRGIGGNDLLGPAGTPRLPVTVDTQAGGQLTWQVKVPVTQNNAAAVGRILTAPPGFANAELARLAASSEMRVQVNGVARQENGFDIEVAEGKGGVVVTRNAVTFAKLPNEPWRRY